MTKLIICCDGTWSTPERKDRGVAAPTNVVRLYNAVVEDAGQRRYYHPGVGADGAWWDKAVAGGTGAGLDRNIQSAYRWLCDNYTPGDDIFLFGFSRGAFTVRSLVGFINCCGLLDGRAAQPDNLWQGIERLFQKGYRQRAEAHGIWAKLGWRFHALPPGATRLPVRFLGVWETVGALGIPDSLAALKMLDNPRKHSFHDTRIGTNVQTARHAVAMDEMRQSFQPTLWTNTGEHQDAVQKWFPGVHSDVGGGYYEAGLANGALQWMVDEAAAAGLRFRVGMLQQVRPNYLDMMHDSCTGAFTLLPTQPRSVPSLLRLAEFHDSALLRHRDPPIHQSPYREAHFAPDGRTIEVYARQQWNATGVWLEAGTKYHFAAKGEWLDGTLASGPAGMDDGHFELRSLAHIAGDALGVIEEWFRRATDEHAIDLRFTRRHEDMPWFCLVGCIANGGGADHEGAVLPHEAFMIADGCHYTPQRSGYFYAYANDAWNCYGNNRGKIDVTVAPA